MERDQDKEMLGDLWAPIGILDAVVLKKFTLHIAFHSHSKPYLI